MPAGHGLCTASPLDGEQICANLTSVHYPCNARWAWGERKDNQVMGLRGRSEGKGGAKSEDSEEGRGDDRLRARGRGGRRGGRRRGSGRTAGLRAGGRGGSTSRRRSSGGPSSGGSSRDDRPANRHQRQWKVSALQNHSNEHREESQGSRDLRRLGARGGGSCGDGGGTRVAARRMHR